MMRLQETDGSRWIDVQFLKAANEKLVECRRVLKYTYVFGYYLPEGTARKRLFEHHQVRGRAWLFGRAVLGWVGMGGGGTDTGRPTD
jgi:hypothetical protein